MLHSQLRSQSALLSDFQWSVSGQKLCKSCWCPLWLAFLIFFSSSQNRMAGCGSCFWCIIWLVVLLFIGWPLGITLGGLYGLISPLTTCLGLDQLSDLLLEGANLGRKCANNMRHCKPLCWDPSWNDSAHTSYVTEKSLHSENCSCLFYVEISCMLYSAHFLATYVAKRSERSGKWIPLIFLTCN